MSEAKPASRRRHDADLKRQVIGACAAPGASVAQVAKSYGPQRQSRAQVEVPGWARLRACWLSCIHPGLGGHRSNALRAARDHRTGAGARPSPCTGSLADGGCCFLRRLTARDAALIRVDAVWLAVEPLDMRAGTEAALRRVVAAFGAARPHHADLFANVALRSVVSSGENSRPIRHYHVSLI